MAATETGSANRRPTTLSSVPYLGALDGLRALAVIAVMVYHADASWLPGGFLGVEVFFVLSGYLITLLLMAETERSGRVNLAAFWARRARRLLPALFATMLALAIYTSLFRSADVGALRGDIVAGFFYVSNWFQISAGAGYAAVGDFAPLRHLWSLAVEEQFYLLWPLVMVVVLRRGTRDLGRVAGGLVLTAVGIAMVTAWLHHPGRIAECSITPEAYWNVGGRCISTADTLYLSTITRSTGLLLGAAFAMVWRPVAVMRSGLRHRPLLLDLPAVAGLVALALFAWNIHYITVDAAVEGTVADSALFRGGLMLTAVATLAVVAATVHPRSLVTRGLSTRPLRWVGTRSYGLYLYHWPIYQVLRDVAGVSLGVGRFIVAMLLTAAAAEVSYRVLEMPIRRGEFRAGVERFRRRAAPGARRIAAVSVVVIAVASSVAGFRVATAELQLNEIAAAIDAGELDVTSVDDLLAGLDATSATTVAPADDMGTGTAETSETAEPVTSTTVATLTPQRDPIPFLAIGDSVMLGAAPVLRERGYTVNAEKSRQMVDVLDFMTQLRDSGAFGDVVVVHLGTNGPIGDETMSTFMSIVADVPMVVMLNVRGDLPWATRNNELLDRLDLPDDNIVVIDWLSESETCTGSCYAGDGIHLNADGREHYANVIRDITGR